MTKKRSKKFKRAKLMEQKKSEEMRNAVSNGDVRLVRELTNQGVLANQMDANGWTLLHLAACKGKEKILRVLLEKGGDAFASDYVGGFTALHYAAMHGRTRIARLLLDFRGIDRSILVDARSEDGWTPLHVASHYGRDSFVELLIGSLAEVDALSDKGTTALQLAIIRERINCIKILLESGANIDVQYGFPLRYAVIKGNLSCARLLLEQGASPSIRRTEDGQTPLHLAALRNSESMAGLLYKFGADVNVYNDEGLAPLAISRMMFQVNNQDRECLNFLAYVTSNPRSLQELCRLVIRQSLGPSHLKRIQELPLSTIMKNYLLYKYDNFS